MENNKPLLVLFQNHQKDLSLSFTGYFFTKDNKLKRTKKNYMNELAE